MADESPEIKQQAVVTVHDEGEYAMLFDSGRFAQAWRVAKLFSTSKLVPATFQGSPESCFVAMHMAVRLNLDPMMVMQKTYIVHGRPGMEAQLVIGLVNARGPFKGPIQWEVTGEGDSRKWTAYATHQETGERCEASVTWDMVKQEGWNKDKEYKGGGGVQKSKWNTLPDLMGRYRSATFLARLYCPEVIMGLSTFDELQDMDNVIELTAEIAPAAPKIPQTEKIKEKLKKMGAPKGADDTIFPDPGQSTPPPPENVTTPPSSPQRAITDETMAIIRGGTPDMALFLHKEGISNLSELTEQRGQEIVDLLNS